MDRETIARSLATADGLDWDEVCGFDTPADECDSSTCIAAHWEEHDPEQARRWYLHLADAILPMIEADRAALAAQLAEAREVLRPFALQATSTGLGIAYDDITRARATLAKLENRDAD